MDRIDVQTLIETLLARDIPTDVRIETSVDTIRLSAWQAELGWVLRLRAAGDVDADIYVGEHICRYTQDILRQAMSIISNIREGWKWDYCNAISAAIAYETLYAQRAEVDHIITAFSGYRYGRASAYRLYDMSYVAKVYCALAENAEYYILRKVDEGDIHDVLWELVDYQELDPHDYLLHLANWHGPTYLAEYIRGKYPNYNGPVRAIICQVAGCRYLLQEDGSPVVFTHCREGDAWADEYIQSYRHIYDGDNDIPEIILVPDVIDDEEGEEE